MADVLYAARATSLTTSDLYTVDPATGVTTSVGAIGYAVTGLAWDPVGGVMYGATSPSSATSPKCLIRVDLDTGAGTLVGAFGGASARHFSDITCDSAGNLYGWLAAGTSPAGLYTIDKTTGVATPIGSDIAFAAGGIAFDSDDVLWFATQDAAFPGDLYTLDTATGNGTLSATITGYAAPSVGPGVYPIFGAISFSPTDVLYGADINRGTGPPPDVDVVTITAPAGVCALVATFDIAGVDALTWVTIPPRLADGGRVSIAFDDPALEPDPTWTIIDDVPDLVAGIDIHGGRQTEFDVTETSTATVLINDTDGLFDPNNTLSPYFGLLDGKQIRIQTWEPVTEEWVPRWRGFIDDYGYDFDPAVNAAGEPLVANVAIQCVDAFEYLASVEMLPGTFGDTPPAGSEGIVFYDQNDVKARIEDLLTDAAWPIAELASIFTGNVDVQPTKYDVGDSILAAIRDAADAEVPGIANVYVDRFGRVVFHGRFARLDPEATAVGSDWIFTRWKAGDGAAIALDSDRAQIRPPLQWSRPRSRIYNAAIAWPRFPIAGTGGGTFTEADMAGQTVVDTTSKDAYGYRAYPAMSDLITLAGTTTGNDAKDETRLFAEHHVENGKNPRDRVEALTFKSISPGDPRGPATWALLCGFDISDVVELTHGYPGGVGIDESLYIEGYEMTVRPLNDQYDMVEVTLNVSPQDLVDVFTP